MVAVAYAVGYMLDVRIRQVNVPNCRWNLVPKTSDVPYLAYFCYVARDTVLLRLYDISNQHLLAERMFFNLDRPNFYWENDAFGYDTAPDGGVVTLPPTVLDRLLARLP